MHSYDEYFDLRAPLRLLLSHWKLIVGTTAILIIAAVAFALSRPLAYSAEATVAISPTRTEVQFDPRIQTLGDYELVSGALTARRDALAALVRSNDVLTLVLTEVEDRLEEDERDVTWLREIVSIETAGDLINIEIEYEDPETAALIANTWVRRYVQHVNQLYSAQGRISDSQIDSQVADAKGDYDAAQTTLEEFEASSPIERIQREVDATIATLENFQSARIAVQTLPSDRNQELLSSYYNELSQIELWLSDAEALREQVRAGSSSSTNEVSSAIALIMLRSRVFGGASEDVSPIFLQFDLSSPSIEPVSVADVDSLILTLEERRNSTQTKIDTFLNGVSGQNRDESLNQVEEQITQLSAELTLLRSQLEAATAQQRELTYDRDSAWETYQLLLNRQLEEQITSRTQSAEVRIADRAIEPSEPVSRGLLRNVIIAIILGTMITSIYVIITAWWSTDSPAISERDTLQTAETDV